MGASVATATLYAFIGNAVIYAGVAFLGEKLLPSLFTSVYDSTSLTIRTVIMLVVASWPANYLFHKVYEVSPDASWAMLSIIGTLLVVLLAKSYMLGDVSFSLRLVGALGVAFAGVLWVAWELGQSHA